ncbi:BrnA antitoxin family protein [Arsukibacterium sp.]|uniref:BrnA antitoxin family protein n=1 Tax=Arsukibacterium sp. TaxID=1977258 RepID=UPI002FDB3F2C
MKKHTETKTDLDNPEWTTADIENSLSIEHLPSSLKTILRGRGPQKEPVKQLVSVRYSPQVVSSFKSTGKGWQTRMDKALQDWLKEHDPSSIEV